MGRGRTTTCMLALLVLVGVHAVSAQQAAQGGAPSAATGAAAGQAASSGRHAHSATRRGHGAAARQQLPLPTQHAPASGGEAEVVDLEAAQAAALARQLGSLPQQAPPAAAAAAGNRPIAAAAAAAAVVRSAAPRAPEGKVLLELFVKSLCPDAFYCEALFAPVLKKFHPFVHVRTDYMIESLAQGQPVCAHGRNECIGNAVQLCVQNNTPPERNYEWFWSSIMCSWRNAPYASYSAVGMQQCLNKTGVTGAARAAMDACLTPNPSLRPLLDSARAASSRGMHRSCTIAIEGQQVCRRDGGEWWGCAADTGEADFAAALCGAYRAKYGSAPPGGLCAGVKPSDAFGPHQRRPPGASALVGAAAVEL